ncbi:D-arabinono-1,4-lactone oxidase [Embleya sp. MST-111070]|uniref:D-arabinono-1,4-lactone oxidase n=1 Tax=Embleya sp. MST-111070 TaxID=3398231 RepID=UPI003F73EDD8
MTHTWHNWAGTEQARPTRVVSPRDTEEVAATVAGAVRDGRRIKAIGSGHSFSPVAVAPDVQMRMDHLDRFDVDRAGELVTVGAGMPLWRLNPLLAEHGLAMEILGDIDRQTVSGAISTGTHGSGVRFGGIATQVRALELVLAEGPPTRCSPDERPELFAAARVGLGALGVITEVTLQCVPSFALHARDTAMPVARVIDEMHQLADTNDHFEFFWFPHSDVALTRRFTRLPATAPLRPIGTLTRHIDKTLNGPGFETICRVGTRFPGTVRPLARFAAKAMSTREWTDVSYRVFASPRDVRFLEGEFAIPRELAAEALREIKRWIDRSDEGVSFPLEVRFAAADDIWLSTAYGRETCYIAFHQYHRMPHQRYFGACRQILADFGGRPHWGKMHDLDVDSLRPRYERFDDFTALRDTVDPGGVFANAYLDRVLGPTPDGYLRPRASNLTPHAE